MDRFLVAPDSFKGTFSAAEVAGAIGRGLEAAGAAAELLPVADGGEGMAGILLARLGGEWRTDVVPDPLGEPRPAQFAMLADGSAAIDTASASGLTLIEPARLDAEAASTRGTGELIAAAITSGARRILLGAGGSATTDGGAGAIDAINESGGLRGAAIEVLCDSITPFERAAEVFAAQKGADGEAIASLTSRLELLADGLPRSPRGVPMGGCGGGLSGGLWAAFGAELRPGAAFVLDLLGFDHLLGAVDAAITGEGRIDAQSIDGKITGEIAARCRRAGRPLHVIAGGSELTPEEEGSLGLASVTIASDEAALETAGSVTALYPS